MTPEEQQALADYLDGKTASSNLTTFDKALNMTGNPLFLWQQGIITPGELLNAVRLATSKPVDMTSADWKPFEEAATGNPVLLTAYDMIKKGYSIGATMDALYREMESAGTAETSGKRLQFIQSDLEEFKKRWDSANDIARRVDAGELFVDGDVVRERMDTGSAMATLRAMGMPEMWQNPAMWEIAADPTLLAEAQKKGKRAEALQTALSQFVNLETGLVKPGLSREIVKGSTAEAQSQYESFLKKTPAGQEVLKKVSGPRTVKTKEEKSKQQSENIKKGLIGFALNTIGLPVAAAVTAYKGGKALLNALPGGNPDTGRAKQEQDQWAKLAASYAGRAKQEEMLKPVTTLQERTKRAEDEALKALAAAKAAGTPLALQYAQAALPTAMALTRGSGTVKRAPRTLSDAEIDQMSSMLAYGG